MAASYTLRNMPQGLWRRIRAAAAYDGINIKTWLLKAAQEKLQNKKEYAMNPYIIIRRNNEVIERIPFTADNLSVAVSEICEEVRNLGYKCDEEDVKILPAEREAQGPDTPERAIIDV